MNILTTDVQLVVIMRRDRERHGPNKSVFEIRGDRAIDLIRPNFNVTTLTGGQVEAFDDATDTSRSRRTRPDNVVVDRVRRGPTALTAAHRLPGTAWNLPAAKAATARVAWAAIRRIILLVTVDEIRNAVVHGDVIHLRNGQLNTVPGLAAGNRYRHAAIISHRHAVRVCWIDPHVVVVAAGTVAKPSAGAQCFATID